MLLKAADKVFSSLVFQILILVATAFTLVPFIHYAYGRYVKYILLFGIIVCSYLLFRNNIYNPFKDKASIAMLCFALFYVITILINRQFLFTENVKQFVYMIVFFVLLFAPNNTYGSTMPVISIVILLLTLFLSFNSFVTYLLNINEWYVIDTTYYIGMFRDSQLWGFYNSNTCGAIAVVSILLSLYIIFREKGSSSFIEIILSLVAIINVPLQFVVLLLSESRGAYYSFLVSITIIVFLALIKAMNGKKIGATLRFFIAIVLSILLVIVLLKVSSFLQTNKAKLCVVTKEESVDSGKDTNYENYIEEILKKYFTDNSALYGNFGINSASIKNSIYKAVGRDSSGTTGRFEIWESAIMVFKEKPLFGWTHEGSLEPLNIEYENITGKSTTSITGGGVHNEYLTVLCSSGVLGFVCFIAVIAIVLIRFLEVLFDKKEVSTELLFSFSVVVYFLVSELVESRILYTVSFYNVVFWLYFGYLNYYCLKGKTNIAEKT